MTKEMLVELVAIAPIAVFVLSAYVVMYIKEVAERYTKLQKYNSRRGYLTD